jgi:hypothetical protein
MVSLVSHWNDSDRHLQYSTDIDYRIIDNYRYYYTLRLILPYADDDDNQAAFCGARIHYRYDP